MQPGDVPTSHADISEIMKLGYKPGINKPRVKTLLNGIWITIILSMISIVIPARDDDIQIFTKTLESLNNQRVKPKEIILVDSSSNDAVKKAFDEFDLGKIKKIYKKIPPAFAGKSTNHGFKSSLI